MKKRIVMIVCMVVMVITAMPVYAVSFSDIEGHWAYDNIIKLAEEGIVNGYEDGTFRPENMVTYGEFMKLVVHKYVPEKNIIKNLPEKHWAAGYVATAELMGLMPKKTVMLEELDLPITRMNMVKVLAIIDSNSTGQKYPKNKELDFIDIGHLPDIYVEYLNRVVNKGYILGNPDKTFKPESNLSRAEMVTILTRL